MKLTIALLVAALAMVPSVLAGNGPNSATGCGGLLAMIAELPLEDVNPAEEADLYWMREEEKLARDVYLAMDGLWGLRVFEQISWSEQNHMNALLALIDKYGLVDPVGDNGPGEFNDPALQALFAQLLDAGSQSLIAALHVGAKIEDLDIHDLHGVLQNADNEDLNLAYQNLLKGSRNHLRAFVGLLEANGETYVPEFLSQEQFDAIIGSPREQGMVDAAGEPIDCGGGPGGSRRGPRYRHWPVPGDGPGARGHHHREQIQQQKGIDSEMSRR